MKFRKLIYWTFFVSMLLTLAQSAFGQRNEQLHLPPVVHVAPAPSGVSETDSIDNGNASPNRKESLGGAATQSVNDSDLLPSREDKQSGSPITNNLLSSSKGGVTTMVGSLAIVVGLFLMLAWFAKRNMPAGQRPLDSDVVQVLGRAPLSGKQMMHLVRLGPKLLLVSVSAQGAETLAEVSDPVEVERLMALCQQNSGGSVSESFRDVLTQFEHEPVQGFLDNPATQGAR